MRQLKRFRDLYNYPVYIGRGLKTAIEMLSGFMNKDENEYSNIAIPVGLKEPKEG